ncbi:hypothetical protein C7999DRAFT_38679 [Corynascus novoguineensis]|uniref:Uncharacterized protein n=1 Tax=Corynascus novoguineensis TaxID=1126955 RepID=A0AAN7CY39_9PEZI|nr:hypothetical protein C7999DRAFT_38679 [Corynascus novoguineensis]
MLPPLRTALARAPRSTSAPFALTPLRQYSSQNAPSPTGAFYKTFTRPVAKCALLAVFVYQLVYFGWSKLETEEIKQGRQAEIVRLEAQVRSLQAAQAAKTATGAIAESDSVGEVRVRDGKGKDEANGSKGSWWRWT